MTNLNSQKGVGAPIVIAIIALAIVIAGVSYYTSKSRESVKLQEIASMKREAMEKKEKEAMVEKDKGEMMKKNEGVMPVPSVVAEMENKESEEIMSAEGGSASGGKYSGEILAGVSALLIDFNKSDYDAALKSDKLTVLYFYANWCPICIAEFPVMQGVFNELSTNKVIGFRVNYNDNQTDDDEKNLAREFGVAYQHTKVFVKHGQRILKSPEGWDKNRYANEINKSLTE